MLQNWLKPLSASASAPGTFGHTILRHQDAMPGLKGVKAALLGIHDAEADAVRQALYTMTPAFPPGTLADLGTLRKPDPALLIPVLNELLSGKITPIVIGGSHESAPAQFLAYQDAKSLVNLVTVDERARTAPEQIYGPLLEPRHSLLFHFALIGYQIHLTPAERIEALEKAVFESMRLGRSKAALEETEPLIRDADLLTFHLSALKQNEAPGVPEASPSGYTVEEACQLCRYAGLSDKLTSFGIYGYNHKLDKTGLTAQVVAQMVWYFLDGFFNRKNDYPVSKDGLTEYIVDFRQLNYQLTFWKSVKSGRWWLQAPIATKRKHERHRLIPCSYQDYQAACREELPDRLIQAFRRFGGR